MTFPANPTQNQIATIAGKQWKWNGSIWERNHKPAVSYSQAATPNPFGNNVAWLGNSETLLRQGSTNATLRSAGQIINVSDVDSGHGASLGNNLNQYSVVEAHVIWKPVSGNNTLFLVVRKTDGTDIQAGTVYYRNFVRGDTNQDSNSNWPGSNNEFIGFMAGKQNWTAHIVLKLVKPGGTFKKGVSIESARWLDNGNFVYHSGQIDLATNSQIALWRIAGYTGHDNWFRTVTIGYR